MAKPKFRPQIHQFMTKARAQDIPVFYFEAINPESWELKDLRHILLTPLKKMGRLGVRLYNNTTHTWDEKPRFDFSKTLKTSTDAKDIGVTIFADPKPMGGAGRRAGAGRGAHNISDIYRWIDWGTKKIIRRPKPVPGAGKYSLVGRPMKVVQKGKGPPMTVYGPAPTVVNYLQFNYPFKAKTFTGAIASFKGSRGDLVAVVKKAKSGIKGRGFTTSIGKFLQARIGPEVEAALLKAINKGIK